MKSLLAHNGWTDVQGCEATARHAQKLLRSNLDNWSPAAAQMVKYLSEFISLRCAPDMLNLRLFPNGKEISESFGAYDAVRYRMPQFKLNDPSVTLIAVGDGNTPRTAATFAMRSAWTCHSVDPNLKGGSVRWSDIKRLTIHAKRIEDVHFEAERAVIVAVHSHAWLPNAVAAVDAAEVGVVAMPCCVRQDLPVEPDREYHEKGVISPCRYVRIWHNAKAEVKA
jgi:hypothetical protein